MRPCTRGPSTIGRDQVVEEVDPDAEGNREEEPGQEEQPLLPLGGLVGLRPGSFDRAGHEVLHGFRLVGVQCGRPPE
jgi:hypothetical protein